GVVLADDRAVGVTLTGGEEVAADAVIIATDAPNAAKLTGQRISAEGRGVTTVYLAGPERLYAGPKLILNANTGAFVNSVAQLTNLAPDFAPAGQHLLAATVLGVSDLSDADLTARCLSDLGQLFPGKDLSKLRQVGIYRVRYAMLDQPPGIFERMPKNETPTLGLFLAGEFTESASLHGAMHSGEKAGAAVAAFLSGEAED
ncbi:MAG TPA: FAD-dependent oxidoreductase, partial [Ktedonobacterales bacterium]